MTLRKINACLSLVVVLLLFDHAAFNGVWMLARGAIVKSTDDISWVMFGAMMVHAILSIVLAILGHKGAEKRKCKGYPNFNRGTYLQRASGIALIVLTVLHIAGTAGPLRPPQIVHAVLPPLFFAIALIHTAISGSKAFITLGIGNTIVYKIADIAIKVLCGVILILDVIGFYLHLC